MIIHTLADGSVRIESFDTDKFLIFDNGKFKGGTPSDGNDIFKKVVLRPGSQLEQVVLRVAKPDFESDFNQGADKECYLGFESLLVNSEPKCFDSISSSTVFWLYTLP